MILLLKKILPCFLIFLFSCSSAENRNDKTIVTKFGINEIATDKFGENYFLDYNKSKEFVICKNKLNNSTNNQIEYFIYDLANDKIIESKVIPLGNISWLSIYEVRVEIHPGMIQKNSNNVSGYILNVKTNSKTKIDGGVN